MTINELVQAAYENSKAHGFHDGDLNIAEKLCLIHSEVSEALEEARSPDFQQWRRTFRESDGKPEGFPSELADIVIRVCDLAGALKIDLEAAIEEKHAFNKTRPIRHGKKF